MKPCSNHVPSTQYDAPPCISTSIARFRKRKCISTTRTCYAVVALHGCDQGHNQSNEEAGGDQHVSRRGSAVNAVGVGVGTNGDFVGGSAALGTSDETIGEEKQ